MAKRPQGSEAAQAVRGAVDRTFQATVGQAQVTRERAQELVDEVGQAAGRVRSVLDELRLASSEDIRDVQRSIERLDRRVAALEAERSTGTGKGAKAGKGKGKAGQAGKAGKAGKAKAGKAKGARPAARKS